MLLQNIDMLVEHNFIFIFLIRKRVRVLIEIYEKNSHNVRKIECFARGACSSLFALYKLLRIRKYSIKLTISDIMIKIKLSLNIFILDFKSDLLLYLTLISFSPSLYFVVTCCRLLLEEDQIIIWDYLVQSWQRRLSTILNRTRYPSR